VDLVDFHVCVAADGSGRTLVTVRGDLDHLTNEQLVRAVARCCPEADQVVIDVAGVTFVDAGGLTALARSVDLCREHRVAASIEGRSALLDRLLQLTGMELPNGA
jgi:anti-anti-sigma factor